jgi:hypothetical protein
MISIVFSTRETDTSYIDHLKKTCGIKEVEIISYVNNGEYSLTQLYNKGLKESTFDIVVFCHDDLFFNKTKWGNKLIDHFKRSDYGILGIAGTTDLPLSGKWWENPNKMVGIVKHKHENKTWESKYSGNFIGSIIPTTILDGLFFAVNKNKLMSNFSEEIKGFHFYDVDFTFKNLILGVKIGVIFDIKLTHNSIGATNQEWEKNRISFMNKWNGILPFNLKGDIVIDNITKPVKPHSVVSIMVECNGDILKCDTLLKSINKNIGYENYKINLVVPFDMVERYEKLRDFYSDVEIIENYSDNFVDCLGYNIESICDQTDAFVFTNEKVEFLNDVISQNIKYIKNKSVGTISSRVHKNDNTVFSCGQQIMVDKENKISLHNLGEGSFYKFDLRELECPHGGKKEFLMISKDNYMSYYGSNPQFKTHMWELYLNLKLLTLNKKNIINNNSVIKINDNNIYNVDEEYKQNINVEMKNIVTYISQNKKLHKTLKTIKQ